MIYSLNDLTENEVHRVIEMAWEDRTPFDVIKSQFGLSEQEVRNLMKLKLKMSSYIRWRNRVEGNNLKHSKKNNHKLLRFKSSRQRIISNNKISKR